MSVFEESRKQDVGFYIYTPLVQQLSMLYSLVYEVRVYQFIPLQK